MHRTRIALVASLLLIGIGLWFFSSSLKEDVAKSANPTLHGQTGSFESMIRTLRLPAGAKSALQTLELLRLNEQPIEYFGRLLDQNDNPVPDARILFSVTRGLPPSESFVRGTVTSDPSGRFKISGYTGGRLGLQPEKNGYLIASTNLYPIFSRMRPTLQYHPNPNDPTIIRMWKSEGHVNLLPIDQEYEIRADGTPVIVDLLGQRLSDSGDLRVSVYRGGNFGPNHLQFNWSYSLEALQGRVKEISFPELQITFAAPTNGYSQSISEKFQANSAGAWTIISKAIVMSSRNGNVYAKFLCEVGIHEDGTASIRLTRGVANTNGSRNLEDRTK
jgi:hypothetical protein